MDKMMLELYSSTSPSGTVETIIPTACREGSIKLGPNSVALPHQWQTVRVKTSWYVPLSLYLLIFLADNREEVHINKIKLKCWVHLNI